MAVRVCRVGFSWWIEFDPADPIRQSAAQPAPPDAMHVEIYALGDPLLRGPCDELLAWEDYRAGGDAFERLPSPPQKARPLRLVSGIKVELLGSQASSGVGFGVNPAQSAPIPFATAAELPLAVHMADVVRPGAPQDLALGRVLALAVRPAVHARMREVQHTLQQVAAREVLEPVTIGESAEERASAPRSKSGWPGRWRCM